MFPLIDLPPQVPPLTHAIQWAAAENLRSAPDSPPMVLAQAVPAGSGGSAAAAPDFLLKQCTEVNNDDEPLTAMNGMDAGGLVQAVLSNKEGRYLDRAAFAASLLAPPTHGKLIEKASSAGIVYWMYQPDPGFLDKDQASFLVKYNGKSYKVVIDILVSFVVDEKSPQCPEPRLIKLTGVTLPALNDWIAKDGSAAYCKMAPSRMAIVFARY